jgi:hypothetical protein
MPSWIRDAQSIGDGARHRLVAPGNEATAVGRCKCQPRRLVPIAATSIFVIPSWRRMRA